MVLFTILQALNKGNNILNLIESATYLQLSLCFILKEKRFIKENGKSSNSYVEKAITYMKGNIDKNFSLDELAHMAGMSKYHFTRCFKKACKLLSSSEYSINKISTMLSYNNKYYFSKQFKEITGYPPTKFRNLINNKF